MKIPEQLGVIIAQRADGGGFHCATIKVAQEDESSGDPGGLGGKNISADNAERRGWEPKAAVSGSRTWVGREIF